MLSSKSLYCKGECNLRTKTFLFYRPSIQFSFDEVIACRLLTNEVQFFDPGDFSKGISHRLRVPGVAGVELSKTPGAYVAVFVPESKVLGWQLLTKFWSLM